MDKDSYLLIACVEKFLVSYLVISVFRSQGNLKSLPGIFTSIVKEELRGRSISSHLLQLKVAHTATIHMIMEFQTCCGCVGWNVVTRESRCFSSGYRRRALEINVLPTYNQKLNNLKKSKGIDRKLHLCKKTEKELM